MTVAQICSVIFS